MRAAPRAAKRTIEFIWDNYEAVRRRQRLGKKVVGPYLRKHGIYAAGTDDGKIMLSLHVLMPTIEMWRRDEGLPLYTREKKESDDKP